MTASHIRLPHSVIVKSPGLLPMHYTVAELARAVGVADRTLRGWLAVGAPHQRDKAGHIWIHGRQFADWVSSMRKPVQQRGMREDQGYCMRCRRVVQLLEPETQHIRGKLSIIRGKCSVCGGTINRGRRAACDSKPSALWPQGGAA